MFNTMLNNNNNISNIDLPNQNLDQKIDGKDKPNNFHQEITDKYDSCYEILSGDRAYDEKKALVESIMVEMITNITEKTENESPESIRAFADALKAHENYEGILAFAGLFAEDAPSKSSPCLLIKMFDLFQSAHFKPMENILTKLIENKHYDAALYLIGERAKSPSDLDAKTAESLRELVKEKVGLQNLTLSPSAPAAKLHQTLLEKMTAHKEFLKFSHEQKEHDRIVSDSFLAKKIRRVESNYGLSNSIRFDTSHFGGSSKIFNVNDIDSCVETWYALIHGGRELESLKLDDNGLEKFGINILKGYGSGRINDSGVDYGSNISKDGKFVGLTESTAGRMVGGLITKYARDLTHENARELVPLCAKLPYKYFGILYSEALSRVHRDKLGRKVPDSLCKEFLKQLQRNHVNDVTTGGNRFVDEHGPKNQPEVSVKIISSLSNRPPNKIKNSNSYFNSYAVMFEVMAEAQRQIATAIIQIDGSYKVKGVWTKELGIHISRTGTRHENDFQLKALENKGKTKATLTVMHTNGFEVGFTCEGKAYHAYPIIVSDYGSTNKLKLNLYSEKINFDLGEKKK
jgi:hypothetical protein